MDIKEMMRVMIMDSGDRPSVGIFWYLPEKHDLFEVHSERPPKTKEIYTTPKLHRDVWKKGKYRALAKGEVGSIYYQDHTKIPRGRIFYKDGKFVVAVGSWYKKYEEELTNLIKDYFDLEEFEYKVDSHWELGHGFSEEVNLSELFDSFI